MATACRDAISMFDELGDKHARPKDRVTISGPSRRRFD
jgi:hypothetical protein